MSNLWVLPEELGDQASSEYAYEAAQTASYLMWALSGRKWLGVNTVTERYDLPITDYSRETYSADPVLRVPERVNPRVSLRLRGQPVISVEKVSYIGGPIAPETDYFVTDRSTLNFDNYVGTSVEVTYTFGTKPPVAGRMAARELAMQFALLWSGDEECSLPDRVTSVSRQGLTFTILDNQTFIDDLKTGVYSVDLFLKTANPDKARARAKVFSPDTPRGRRIR